MRLRTVRPQLRTLDHHTVSLRPKSADPHYLTAEHRSWRVAVLKRAGYQCEAIEHGHRCQARAPSERLFADHVIERRDRPDLELAVENGQCLCGRHHTLKTAAERANRIGGGGSQKTQSSEA